MRSLDVLRGVAILLVLGRHANLAGLKPSNPMVAGLYIWQMVGWCGVDLFFVLSGFLVSGLLFAEYRRDGDLRVGRFLARRGLKIYPAFYAFLALSVLHGTDVGPGAPFGGTDVSWPRVASEALFLQGYTHHVWTHTWSLAVEEHFYLLVALGVGLLAARGVRRRLADPFAVLVPVTVGIAVYSLVARVVVAADSPVIYGLRFTPTHLRLDALAFGTLLAYLYHFHRAGLTAFVVRRRWLIVCASAVLIAPIVGAWADTAFMQTVGLTMAYLGFGGILLVAVVAPERPPRIVRAVLPSIAWLGTYSYSVYLWHFAMRAWAPAVIAHVTGWTPGPVPELVIYLVSGVVVGVGMAKLIEMPVLALRDRWLPSRRVAIPAPAMAPLIEPAA